MCGHQIIRHSDKQYIFFDIEAHFVNLEHVPILLVAHKVCKLCANNMSSLSECDVCCENFFKGTECVQFFIQWLIETCSQKHTSVLAHNLKKYDGLFILKKLHELGKCPKFLNRGCQIWEITIP